MLGLAHGAPLATLLERAFPNEADLSIIQSGVKHVGRAELLTRDSKFLSSFSGQLSMSNYLRMFYLPDDMREAIQVLMCERTFLVQLVKGVLEQAAPLLQKTQQSARQPKFVNDPFLEQQYDQ